MRNDRSMSENQTGVRQTDNKSQITFESDE